MNAITFHGVQRIELVNEWPKNNGSRTIKISGVDFLGRGFDVEISLYGDTEAVASLPKAPRILDQ